MTCGAVAFYMNLNFWRLRDMSDESNKNGLQEAAEELLKHVGSGAGAGGVVGEVIAGPGGAAVGAVVGGIVGAVIMIGKKVLNHRGNGLGD